MAEVVEKDTSASALGEHDALAANEALMSSSTKAPGLRSASTGAAAAVAATAAASSSSSASTVETIAPPTITASEQALAACSGSVIMSVLMTPFDVVKVRQQAWAQ